MSTRPEFYVHGALGAKITDRVIPPNIKGLHHLQCFDVDFLPPPVKTFSYHKRPIFRSIAGNEKPEA